ncbi:hypothetical protein ACFYWX_03505 [Streptomyces sp. NPDC002888]|uniref:hypothetical protein n=1 Tax=Streptomyces sp. NPDC002888 TaxID=3364668 RepID=UPI00367CB83B
MKWGRAVGVGGLVLLLGACGAEHSPLYVEKDGGQTVVGWRECPGGGRDGIVEVELFRWDGSRTIDEPGEPLWRIEAEGGVVVHRVRLGSAPDGFVTRLPLTVPLDPGATYALRANLPSEEVRLGFVTFRPEQLSAGRVVFGSEESESREDYDARDEEQFGCFAG